MPQLFSTGAPISEAEERLSQPCLLALSLLQNGSNTVAWAPARGRASFPVIRSARASQVFLSVNSLPKHNPVLPLLGGGGSLLGGVAAQLLLGLGLHGALGLEDGGSTGNSGLAEIGAVAATGDVVGDVLVGPGRRKPLSALPRQTLSAPPDVRRKASKNKDPSQTYLRLWPPNWTLWLFLPGWWVDLAFLE